MPKQSNDKTRHRSTFMYEGKRYETTGKTQKEADQKAAVRLERLKRGEVGISGDMTVARFADTWLETYKKPKVGDGQYNNYKLYIKTIVVGAIGSMRLKQVKDIHLQQILNDRASTEKSKSDLSKLRSMTRAMFKRATKSKLIPYNPAEDLELPAAKDGTHRSITEDERKMILELAETHYSGLWIMVMLCCGLRPGETRALNWKHVDLIKRRIYVEEAMKAATKKIGEPKSRAGIRKIPIPRKLIPTLIKAQGLPNAPVFVQPTTGKRHTAGSMNSLWANFKRVLDINAGAVLYRNKIIKSKLSPDLQPYCLRHTFCTDLEAAGVPINVAKYLMGHSDIALTAKIYTHTDDRAIAAAADKIDNADVEIYVENMRI